MLVVMWSMPLVFRSSYVTLLGLCYHVLAQVSHQPHELEVISNIT